MHKPRREETMAIVVNPRVVAYVIWIGLMLVCSYPVARYIADRDPGSGHPGQFLTVFRIYASLGALLTGLWVIDKIF
ncbi:MAG: hypothetical protein A2172_04045 [Candidatus Woykebacteria bacterium RBG_13_40_15]|uniref:Uncharacterized protein n=1 Tax=Candidatus Woykebacteria bacterium RBG_13_40_15 TaxID=1802593 RepID=A0A1G1W6P5_9BACT|nr:MAG: hypothetical protein A2172_04045 [Candidatus Woykebacteria bacterium RBG_13_40_15]